LAARRLQSLPEIRAPVLEIDVDGLARNAIFSVLVDGVETGVFQTNAYGGAELERYGRVTELSARAAD
jgi:hypothetical protein